MSLVIKILPVQNIRKIKSNTQNMSKQIAFGVKPNIDRRKRMMDRRHCVRSGIHLWLTFKTDQRKGVDRRKKHLPRSSFWVCLAAEQRKFNGKCF